jgi:drug/metabolite transporter (DMT)-like permease
MVSGTPVRMGALALLWGSGFLWIKVALAGLTPVQITLARCVLGAATLLVLAFSARQHVPRGRSAWLHLGVAAFFCNVAPFTLYALGERTVDSGVAGVLAATNPLWTAAIGFLLRSDQARLGGVLLGFTGTLLIFAPWRHGAVDGWGALALLGAAASQAVGFVYMARYLVGKSTGTIALAASQLALAAGLSALALPLGGLRPVQAAPSVLIAVMVLGTCGTGVSFYLNYRLIADEGATTAATVGYLVPVVSVALGAAFLSEHVSPRLLAGMAVVLAGVALTRRSRRFDRALK